MSSRRSIVVAAAIVLLAVGLFALWYPVYLDQYDKYGFQINCGRGFAGDLSQEVLAGRDRDTLVDRCDTALLIRRAWAIPLAVACWLIITGFLIGWLHHAPQREQQPAHS